jgi:hypothetical protein
MQNNINEPYRTKCIPVYFEKRYKDLINEMENLVKEFMSIRKFLEKVMFEMPDQKEQFVPESIQQFIKLGNTETIKHTSNVVKIFLDERKNKEAFELIQKRVMLNLLLNATQEKE